MQTRIMPGYEGGLTVGQRRLVVFIGTGPEDYVEGGDPVSLTQFPHLDRPEGGITVSGTYRVDFKPSVAGPRAQWKAIFTKVADAEEVEAGTDLSKEEVVGWALGGDF